jgi:hypothetical protein
MADHEVNRGEPLSPEGKEDNEVNTPVQAQEEQATPAAEASEEEVHSEAGSEVPVTELIDRIQTNPSPTLQTLQGLGIQAFFWLQMVWQLLNYLGSKTIVVTKSVVRGLQPKLFVFFQGSRYPYRLQNYTLAGPGVAPVDWIYDADNKVFLSSQVYNSTTDYTTHHFPWLSGEIKYNDLVLYDISDFLEDIKWAGTTRPTPSHVLAAWSLDSGIVLNEKEGLTLHTITEDGSEVNVSLTA